VKGGRQLLRLLEPFEQAIDYSLFNVRRWNARRRIALSGFLDGCLLRVVAIAPTILVCVRWRIGHTCGIEKNAGEQALFRGSHFSPFALDVCVEQGPALRSMSVAL
jgi:hypothetical protein